MPDMTRSEFIALVGGSGLLLATKVRRARAQQPAMPTVGFLRDRTLGTVPRMAAFRQGLKEAGFVEGQNVAIEDRSAEDQTDGLPLLVADLLRRQVALIVGNTPAALAAKAATTTVPIVFVIGGVISMRSSKG
jgi:putative ABC transport system substrate-binding protein